MRKTHIGLLLSLLVLVSACFKDENFQPSKGDSAARTAVPSRLPTQEVRRVMIMVSAGYNSLSSYLTEDLEELSNGYLPTGRHRTADVLLVLARLPKQAGDYTSESAPVLYRMYADANGGVHHDTLRRWGGSTPLTKVETLHEALDYIQQEFPAKGYGMVFSSHASGWLPDGYYTDPSAYESSHAQSSLPYYSQRGWNARGPEVFPPLSNIPAVKSIGQDKIGNNNAIEMELKAFEQAIPMHLDYLLFDACLMGCVEVAYAFRKKADAVGFSQTEVLANGFDYSTLTQHLLGSSEPNPKAVCKDYFDQYDKAKDNRCATISLVNPAQMEPLATLCAQLFEKYRSQIETLSGSKVQEYFRFKRHYFYDFQDILLQAGITQEERVQLQAALDQCILYKAATPTFLGITIRQYSGLSMYLPSMGTDLLDKFYKENMDWNTATQLVK